MSAIAASKRYRTVCGATVRRLADDALAASSGDSREATKRTKRALHQIYGAYLPSAPPWRRMIEDLERAHARADPEALRSTLRDAMARHASTRERLDLLDRFYGQLEPHLGRPRRLLDVACGLNPLSVPWQRLAPDAHYVATEIDSALVEFLRASLDLLGVSHDVRLADALDPGDLPEVEVALILKLLPTLERQREGSGLRLLDALPAPLLVVSFPTRSLGRREKGFAAGYARDFAELLERRPWSAEQLELPGELVYVVRK